MMFFLAKRLIQLVIVLLGVSVIIFFMIHLVPGDPVTGMLGPRASEESTAALRDRLGLGKSVVEQYVVFLGNALHGDLGISYFYHKDVTAIVVEKLGLSLLLMTYSMVLAVTFAVPLGIVAALRRETKVDHAIRGAVLVGSTIPNYWLGTVLILAFVLVIPLFPISPPAGATLPQLLWSLFLPALVTSIALFPAITRALRASLVESIRTDYVLLARSKGLGERAIFLRHAFRPSLIPVITIIGVNASFLIGGQIVVEAVFGLPGLGQLMIHAVETRDYPVVVAATLIFAVLVVVINLATDLFVAVMDPRARVVGSER